MRRRRFPSRRFVPRFTVRGSNVLYNRAGVLWPDKFVCKHGLKYIDQFVTSDTTYNQQRYYVMNYLRDPTFSGLQVQDYDHLALIYTSYHVMSWKAVIRLRNVAEGSMNFVMYPGHDTTDLSDSSNFELASNQKYSQRAFLTDPLGMKPTATKKIYFPVVRDTPVTNINSYIQTVDSSSTPASASILLLNMHSVTNDVLLSCQIWADLTFYVEWINRKPAFLETLPEE